MVKPILLLDMDGPLADLEGAIRRHMETEHGIFLPEARFETFREDTSLPDDVKHKIYEHMHSPGFSANLRVEPGAKEAVLRLEQCYDIYVLSKPMGKPHNSSDKKEWLYEHFPRLADERAILTGSKHLVFGDVFVDDHAHRNLRPWSQMWPNSMPIAYEKPYNAGFMGFRGTWQDGLADVLVEISGTFKR